MSEIKFLFVVDTDVGSPIDNGEGISVLGIESASYVTSLISNEMYRSDIYAPEMNWYVKHTQAPKEEQKEVLKKLYEMRFIRHTHAPKKAQTLSIDRSVMMIGESEEALALIESARRYFDVTHILPQDLIHLEGNFGSFKARIHQKIEEEGEIKEEEVEVCCAQLVLCDQKSERSKNRGVECVLDYGDEEVLLKRIRNRIGFYEYKQTISYDETLCSYHHNVESTCTKCVEICPSFGIVSDDVSKELHFSALDCIACGKCVGACPTGAIDFAPFSQKAFLEVAQVCGDKHLFLIAEPYLRALDGCEIPSGYIPFVVETDQFLSRNHLLTLLNTSGNTLLFFAPDISLGTLDALHTLNAESIKEQGKQVIELVQNNEAFHAHMALTCKRQNEERIHHG